MIIRAKIREVSLGLMVWFIRDQINPNNHAKDQIKIHAIILLLLAVMGAEESIIQAKVSKESSPKKGEYGNFLTNATGI